MSEELFSPAKLTKYLKVIGVRDDGMHIIEAEMVTLSFGDFLEIRSGTGIEVVDGSSSLGEMGIDISKIPTSDENLVAKALNAVGKRAQVVIHKSIPPGAGLGGGSSNAGCVFRYLKQLPESDAVRSVGADVAFCVLGGRALATGIGDQLEQLEFLQQSFLLLISPFSVSTMDVYKTFDLVGPGGHSLNDLELAAVTCEPRLADSKRILADISGREPTMAGSGATFFVNGSFDDLDLELEVINAKGWRFADVTSGTLKYRLVETHSVPMVEY